MMRKKRGPALYELINSKQSVGENPLKTERGRAKREEVDLDHNVLTPGRSIRVSIGTIGLVAAVCIALIVISFTMGFQKGSAITREDYEQNSFKQIAESFTEPEVQDAPNEPVQSPNVPPPAKVTSTQELVNSAWSPILSDPRALNTYYFTLMQTTKEGAMQLATFCRQKGLETYVVSGNNTRLYRVVALPGSTDPSDPSLRKVQSHVHAIGREWDGSNTGRGSDLKDAYLSIKMK
jgi:hypothetical protein